MYQKEQLRELRLDKCKLTFIGCTVSNRSAFYLYVACVTDKGVWLMYSKVMYSIVKLDFLFRKAQGCRALQYSLIGTNFRGVYINLCQSHNLKREVGWTPDYSHLSSCNIMYRVKPLVSLKPL